MKKVNTFYTVVIKGYQFNLEHTVVKSCTKKQADQMYLDFKALKGYGSFVPETFTVLECVALYTETFSKPEPKVTKKRNRAKK